MVLGIGIDIIDIERVARMLDRDASRLAARVLTEDEWLYCSGKHHPALHVAARLAAKEAAFKALAGTYEARTIGWREIEVRHDEHRRPSLRFHGRAGDRCRELAVARSHLSLSHSQQTAAAVVVLETDR